MRLIGVSFVVAFFLLLSTVTLAQTNHVKTEVAQSRCNWFGTHSIAKVNIVLKDNQKLKGKVVVIQGDRLVIVNNHQTQVIPCMDVARVERPRGFGHRLKYFVSIPIALAGVAIALPGLIVVAAGAREVGYAIATPGLFLVVASLALSESDSSALALLYW